MIFEGEGCEVIGELQSEPKTVVGHLISKKKKKQGGGQMYTVIEHKKKHFKQDLDATINRLELDKQFQSRN